MKKHLFSRMVVVGAVVVLMGLGVNAFAGTGTGPGSPGMGSANLTDDQIKQMESERNAFLSSTKDIRQQLNEKRQALHTELAKQTPDAATAAALQKGISDLQAQFEQKRLTHILKMKKIDPNFVEGQKAWALEWGKAWALGWVKAWDLGWAKVLPAADRKRPIKQ